MKNGARKDGHVLGLQQPSEGPWLYAGKNSGASQIKVKAGLF